MRIDNISLHSLKFKAMKNQINFSLTLRLLAIILPLTILYSCTNNKSSIEEEAVDSKVLPKAYVNFVTEGNISTSSEIRIDFNTDIELIRNDGDIIEEEIFDFDPQIKGKVYWNSDNSLIFQPTTTLKNGRSYKASVDLGKLFKLDKNQNKLFKFNLNVVPLFLTVNHEALQANSRKDTKHNFISGKITASDVISKDKLSEVLTATQDNKDLKIVFTETYSESIINFKIENIIRTEKDGTIDLKWNGKKIGSESKGEIKINVPAIGKFELSDIKIVDSPTQYVEVSFSDPIDKEINLNGIVYLVDINDVKYTVESNKILLYPAVNQTGDAVVVVRKEIKNSKGISLESDIKRNIHFGQIEPQVKFIDNGVIMPGKEGWILPFEAVNLSKVDIIIHRIFANNVKQFLQVNELNGRYQLKRVSRIVHKQQIELFPSKEINDGQWHTYAVDLSKMIIKGDKGIYRVQIRIKKEYSLYNCEGDNFVNDNEAYGYRRGNYYEDDYYYPSHFRWNYSDNPCSESYFYYERFIEKNVLPSNIGLIIKGSNENPLAIFATDLRTTDPINNLKISIFDYQQQLLEKVYTDKNGKVVIDNKNKPWLIVANRGDEFAFVKILGGNSLSYSKFDTRGVKLNNGIKAFIYGDRGVWRPGDTLFLTMIVSDNNADIPQNHPATLKLYNPKSKLVVEKTLIKNKNGFYAFAVNTSSDDLSGVWWAKIKYGGSEFSKRIRIENLKPNRLKILVNFDNEMLLQGDNKASLSVKWLHGGIASNLKVVVNASIKSMKTKFKDYTDYNFDDIGRYFAPDELVVLESELNEKGEIDFNIKLPPSRRAPGKLKVNFITRVFEKGGDFSIDQSSSIYSPFKKYIGIQSPTTTNGSNYLEVDTKHRFEVVTLDADGQLVSLNNLKVEIYKLSWSWWYGSDNRSSSRYIQTDYSNRVYSTTINSKNGKAFFDFEISYPMWGRYYVSIKDPNGGHSTGSIVYLDWPSWYSRENRNAPGDASLLSLTTDKETYAVGDTIMISLPSPANSNILVSLESNERIVKSWWQKSDAEESLIKFVATADMAPNIYSYISVIQPFEGNSNDLPMRMYGIVPIMVKDPQTVLQPVLSVPKSIRPNSNYKIQVSENNGNAMTYTIAIVDEGLLDLTHFKTPEPHKYFYAKEALSVKTWDMFDYVMKAFRGNLSQTFAIGGSDEGNENTPEKKKANRFKAAVTFLGPFTLEKDKITTHEVTMTNYIGSVRFMIVAGDNGSYGHAEKAVAVKQPLMVLATMPRVLAPGEIIKLPVSVFVMDDKIKDVSIKIIPNEYFKCSKTKKTLTFSAMGEKDIYFDVDVRNIDGIGKIKVEVESGNETAFYEVEIEIRNPNPRIYNVEYYKLDEGEELTINPEYIGADGSNELNISISSMPQINLEERMNYLIRYPYGCIEQTTSSVFPQLFLDELSQLDSRRKKKIEINISLAIKRIFSMQTSRGGFGYWPGSHQDNDWGTSYAGHFLITAKSRAYTVPHSLLSNWKVYQKKASNNWNPIYNSKGMIRNDLSQAYRLYTLSLAGTPNLSAMNRMFEMKGLHGISKYQLASAYALAGQINIAKELIEDATFETPQRDYWRWNYGSETRDKAMMIEPLYLTENQNAIPLVMEISEQLRSDSWMSTQTTAFSLYAIGLFTKSSDNKDAYSFRYIWNGDGSEEIIPTKPIFEKSLIAVVNNKLSIVNTGSPNIFIAVTTSGIPPLGEVIQEQNNIKLEVVYKDMNGKIINVANLKHGLDFYAEITVRNPGNYGKLNTLALTQIFPSGWEIINTRVFDLGSELKSDKAEFVDYRDDRVNFFFSLKRGSKKKFIVLLNAAYKGKYYLPATQCSHMYNNDVKAVVGGGWIKVE